MCGILGSINLPFDQSLLDLIKHRGPDDSGIENFLLDNHEIYFGQRRLSILDLSPAGHQPMISNCQEYAIIFNGEIYNHEDLKKKLPVEIKFKGHSDTETILYFIKEFGIGAIRELNGIFSIAFLDLKEYKLFLARDPFGVKPLYFHHNIITNQLIFSSEIRPIKDSIKDIKLNKEAMASLLRLRYNASPYTLYKEINKVRPGHYLEVNLKQNNLSVSNIPFLRPLPETINSESKAGIVEKYGEYFEMAVKRQLLADVPVGILLSGGIDSAMVASLAQKHSKHKLKAFTIGFEGDFEEDEVKDAEFTAQILGLEHFTKKINFQDFLSLFKECTKIVEEPLATTSIIPMYFLAELASQHVKVVLTGQGADEPLGGYPRYKSEIIASNVPFFIQNPLKKIFSHQGLKNEKLKRGLHTLGIRDELSRFLATYEVFTNQEINELINYSDNYSIQSIKYFYEILKCDKKTHGVERMMAIDTRMNLADDLLNYTDKITMNFALECRVPILDLELVDFIEKLPYHLKLNLKNGKLIHKEFAQTLLPDEIIFRKKKGFKSPTNYWFKNESSAIKAILLKEKTAFSNIFNLKKVQEIISQHEKGYPKEKQIFLLLGIYYFLENFENK
jgi:asparagine synthase (glutamine-hydrolysing)